MKPTPFWKKYYLHHMAFWLLLGGIWYYFRYEDYARPTTALQITLLKLVDLALLVYITNGWLIPRFLYRKQYLFFVLAFITLVIVSSLLKMQWIGSILNNPDLFSLKGNLKARIYDNILPHFFLVTAGAAVKLMVDQERSRKAMAELQKEKVEAELAFLRSQINPHFLFNSLNGIYFQIDKTNLAARDMVQQFADLLRYQLYDCNEKELPIEKEIKGLNDYIRLQKWRKDEQCRVEANLDAGAGGFSIPPLLLIPFVENAFKHVSHYSDSTNFISITMKQEGGQLCFITENSFDPDQRQTEPAGGIGLSNVRRRLELYFPRQDLLTLTKEGGLFRVELRLPIRRTAPLSIN